jgi:hypothetical protein
VPLPRTPPPRTEPIRDEDRKQAQAVRVDTGSIHLDGHLDDEAWQRAIPITDFLQAASSVTEGDHVGVNDLFGSLSAPGDNIFALKTTIWLAR